jgi:hypothetical protein
VLLIGTNDLAQGRSPALTADGIRGNLEVLRKRLPQAAGDDRDSGTKGKGV